MPLFRPALRSIQPGTPTVDEGFFEVPFRTQPLYMYRTLGWLA